eukprot:UN07046
MVDICNECGDDDVPGWCDKYEMFYCNICWNRFNKAKTKKVIKNSIKIYGEVKKF